MSARLDRPGDGVAVLTLDDPDRRNVLGAELNAAVAAALDDVEGDPVIGAVVVTGAGPAFCAGADLGDLTNATEETLRPIYDGFLRVARCPLPVVAAVNGPAVGAGVNLAMSCDLRIASTAARFDARFLDIGLHPGGGYTWLLRQAMGPQGAAAMALFGQILHAYEALRAGLVWRVVEPDVLVDEAVAVAARAATFPRDLTMEVKRTLARMAGVTTHAEAVEVELTPQLWSTRQPWFAERLAALKQRVSKKG